jgi:FKBP-type peptidyl-prolyl cis-trans isomerase
MTKKRTRAAALLIAILFFATSVAFSGIVIWQISNDKKQDNAETAQQQAAPTDQPKEGQLAGTKLTGFTPVATVDKLQTIDLKEGTGNVVNPGATVTAHYTGALAKDGTIFESSQDSGEPATFPLGQVIQGWQQGVPGMKAGGTRRLVIPASLAYGEQGSPPKIGPNEPLVFDIELIEVKYVIQS